VKSITADALERPADGRDAFLTAACAGDATLRSEVESLLRADARAAGFLAGAALGGEGAADVVARIAEAGSVPDAAGRRVGPYRIVRELGRGGMGVVYLAERADAAFDKQVAIKVVRAAAFAGEPLLARFREERRILATLDHPNIARLIDAGTAGDGLPYLVMEYVDGVPLDVHCAAAGSMLPQRLALFARVCAAVQYAHERLVIHRDLKAGNVLVTSDGTPKLLDFGIARLLDPGLAPDDRTRTGLRALTLDSASPEQVRGEALTVTSDVYALGVLLYRLLCGRRPYGSRPTEAELMRAICEEIPPRPSAVAGLPHRRELRGELDWITMKALRKEPGRRYASVEHLADDVRRHLAGRPVAAAPDSWSYRAGKFVRRNRAPVAASALLLGAVAAGLAATLWQARRADEQRARAERRFAETRKLAASVMGELHDAIAVVPGATAARELLLRRACEHLDGLAAEAPDDPALAEEIATAYHRLGELQASASNPSLGDAAGARASHRKGLALRRALAARAPADLEARGRLVDSLVSAAYSEDEVGPSLALGEEAVAVAASLVAALPGEPRSRARLGAAHYMVGSHHREVGDVARALASFEAAAPLFQAALDADPGDASANRSVALCHKRVGAILVERGSPAAALPHLRTAVALDEKRLARTPAAPRERRDVSVSATQLGNALLAAGDAAGAWAAFRRALALREGLMSDDPHDARAPRDVATALWWIGNAESALGSWPEAIASFRRALPLATPNRDYDDLPNLLVHGLASAYAGAGRLPEAVAAYRQAAAERRALLARRPQLKTVRRALAETQNGLGAALSGLRRWGEARDAYDEGLAVASGFGAGPLEPGEAAVMEALRKGRERCIAASRPRRAPASL
jgi:tetratricopeptide (TPR) repeat protein